MDRNPRYKWDKLKFIWQFFFGGSYLFNNSSKELLMLFQIEVCKSSSVAVIFSHTEQAANPFWKCKQVEYLI